MPNLTLSPKELTSVFNKCESFCDVDRLHTCGSCKEQPDIIAKWLLVQYIHEEQLSDDKKEDPDTLFEESYLVNGPPLVLCGTAFLLCEAMKLAGFPEQFTKEMFKIALGQLARMVYAE